MNPATLITICILAVLIGLAAFSFVRRLTARQTCCGTTKVRPSRKKLKKTAGKLVFSVEGMHCNHCKSSIENAINALEGLAARVNLERKTLTVSYAPDTKADPGRIISLLGELGFTATLIL